MKECEKNMQKILNTNEQSKRLDFRYQRNGRTFPGGDIIGALELDEPWNRLMVF